MRRFTHAAGRKRLIGHVTARAVTGGAAVTLLDGGGMTVVAGEVSFGMPRM